MSILPDRPTPSTVTLRLMNGQNKVGRMQRFSPIFPDLSLESQHAAAGTRGGRQVVPAERVAVVVFHVDPNRPSPVRPSDLETVTLTLAFGERLVIEASAGSVNHVLGFYGFLVGQRDVAEVFVYAHAIISREQGNKPHAKKNEPVEREPFRVIDSVPLSLDPSRRRASSIAELVTMMGVATPEDIAQATEEVAKRGSTISLSEVLVEMRIVPEETLASMISAETRFPFVNLEEVAVDPLAVSEVPVELIKQYSVLPVQSTPQELTVATSDPFVRTGIEAITRATNKRVSEIIVLRRQLRAAIAAALERASRRDQDGELDQILQELTADEIQVAPTELQESGQARESDSAVIKLVNQIILDAYRRGASDIHIEPNGRDRMTRVRFRVDGDCIDYQEIPAAYRRAIVARIKIMASLDISERRKPQDGKIRFRMRDREIELRVATIPTVGDGEDIVMRILAAQRPMPLKDIGLSERNLRELQKIMAMPYGLALCVGPTGSGKTTTLHSMLGSVNTGDVKIWTAEDPVEITQPGLRQVQVQPKIGFTFAAAMRAFLRADPDIIMVGEMRDRETASIGVEASLTGHLVLSTLHTNTAPETVIRLVDMGLDPFSFADALRGVVAQRLVRVLCNNCKEPYNGTHKEYEEIAAAYGAEALRDNLGVEYGPDFMLFRGRGCGSCGSTGYRGRMGLHELLVADDVIRTAIQQRAPIHELRRMAMMAGMTTLAQDGVEKSLFGLTDMKQVLAVCSR